MYSAVFQKMGTKIPRIAKDSRYNSCDRPVLRRVRDNPGLQFVRLREMDTHYVEYTRVPKEQSPFYNLSSCIFDVTFL